MKDIYWVMEDILAGRCGPARAGWEPAALRAAGFGGVVSLDPGDVDADALTAAGLDHLPLYLPMTLLLNEADRLGFLRALLPVFDFIDGIRRRPAATLVHCHYGLDRTGAVLACYLVARERFHARQAIDYIRQQRPQAMFAPGYAEAVELFEEQRLAAGPERLPHPNARARGREGPEPRKA